MTKYLKNTLFVCMLIALSQLNANADVSEGLFNKYFEHSGKLNTDKFVDAMRNGEVNIDDIKTIRFLETLTKHDLQLLRNTFFAKHGFIFKTPELQQYFNQKQWYVPQQNQVVLPTKEKKIVSLIQKIESCENVTFADFRSLFTRLSLPLTYGDHLKRTRISMINIRKFLNVKAETYLPYYAIGELYSSKFLVLLYEASSFETQPAIATFSLDGKLISNKSFFSIGGDIMSYTDGKLYIDNDLTIHIETEDSSSQSEIKKTGREKYHIDLNGNIAKIK